MCTTRRSILDSTEYSGRYESTQGYSPTFNAFHERLAQDMIDRFDLHGKEIIEIGCGNGEFLVLLCELGREHPDWASTRRISPVACR